MLTTQKLLIFLTTSSLLIFSLIHAAESADANKCSPPSACGAIRNISIPFHLKSDPIHCGRSIYELTCENNVTFLYHNSIKYYVKHIDYQNSTIRLVDASINNDNICSFPIHSSYLEFTTSLYYSPNPVLNLSLNLISCPNPLNDTSLFKDITQDCASSLSHPGFSYVYVGHIKASEGMYLLIPVAILGIQNWYVAPELINRSIGRVSYKADVYSFGMLLMEMVSLNKHLARNNDESSKYFPNWIYDHLNQGRDIDVENVDENDNRNIVRKMTIVALWCIQMSPDNRPSMNKVVDMLEGDVEHLQIPNYPAYVAGNEEGRWTSDSNASISLLHDDNGSSIINIISDA
ncbi:hypothetical protein SASPL_150824 [Salvia splendens]|uniref:Uncharacterized protein n=1 Tax=Salvia splendens TaxID=180675 RepID=A0A8X8W860_SALSN|nr:hypothetical protein SASPL_150824 [Salvia splendens]